MNLGNAIPVNISVSNHGSDSDDNTGDDSGDNTVITPKPVPIREPDNNAEQPEPTLLVGYVEEAPEKAPLIWAEVAPGLNTDTSPLTKTQYVVIALEGEKTLEELGGKATVIMDYTVPAEYAGKRLYVIFRNKDGSLTAIPATYSKGLLRFITDRLGTFMVVGLDYDIDKISEKEFYVALAELPELENLVYTEYTPV